MSIASSSLLQTKNNGVVLPSPVKSLVGHQLNAMPLGRVGVGLGRTIRASRSSVVKRTTGLEKKFYGAKLRASGSERLHLWQSDGPGRAPKLRVVVRSALSQVPEKPLGLYDPSFDKDSCGVGFVAELSGESSRKTVNQKTLKECF